MCGLSTTHSEEVRGAPTNSGVQRGPSMFEFSEAEVVALLLFHYRRDFDRVGNLFGAFGAMALGFALVARPSGSRAHHFFLTFGTLAPLAELLKFLPTPPAEPYYFAIVGTSTLSETLLQLSERRRMVSRK